MQTVKGMPCEPANHFGGLVCSVIVQHQMHFPCVGGKRRVHQFHKLQKTPGDGGGDGICRPPCRWRCPAPRTVKLCHGVRSHWFFVPADPVAKAGLAGFGPAPAPAIFIIYAQHNGMFRRIQIQTHDVAHFLHQPGIGGEFERLAAVRLQTETVPDAYHRALAEADFGGQRARAPVGRRAGRLSSV